MSTTEQPYPQQPLIRVVRGRPGPAELAALTAVLLARTPAADGTEGTAVPPPASAGWRRPERTRGFLGPRTWRGGTPATPGD